MLTALEQGVKGGVWYSLIDKVASESVLRAAFKRVKRNRGAPGVDRITVEMFEADLDVNLAKLRVGLLAGTYEPQAIRRQWIPKPGRQEKRPLGIPTVRDRVVQSALRSVLEPIYEREFAGQSYGFRPGRGCKDALRRVEELLKAGYTWVVDADLASYFDTIPRQQLRERMSGKVADSKVLDLVEAFMRQQVMDDVAAWTPERGAPQGAVISPLLSNIYLDPLDHKMAAKGYEMVRYADDFVILCRSEEAAQTALSEVEAWVAEAKLSLHRDKTRIVDATMSGGFDFLGYHFERGYKWPGKKSLKKLKDTVRGHTRRRANGNSLETTISALNPVLRGWFEYYKHSHRTTFRPLDGWVRMRLRSTLRNRRGQRGHGRGPDHQRWPNTYFAEHGLFSLTAAWAAAAQSSRR
jgi:RNA-directed DNA polymerase